MFPVTTCTPVAGWAGTSTRTCLGQQVLRCLPCKRSSPCESHSSHRCPPRSHPPLEWRGRWCSWYLETLSTSVMMTPINMVLLTPRITTARTWACTTIITLTMISTSTYIYVFFRFYSYFSLFKELVTRGKILHQKRVGVKNYDHVIYIPLFTPFYYERYI